MIPNAPPLPGPGAKAERILYEALREQLGDDFFVYNRLKYVEPKRASEGETDFLILHRELGLLVIECKGGGVTRSATGEWMRIVDGAKKPLSESPFEQAQRHVWELRKILEPRTLKAFPGLKRFPFACGHSVAFPLALKSDANLPLDVPPQIIFDASDLGRMAQRINDALAFWKKAAPDASLLSPHEFKGFRKKILHPHLDVSECLAATVLADSRIMVQLTSEQAAAVEGWLENPRLRVQGGAGTGKTVLALEAAKRIAKQGSSVLIVCYNKQLGSLLDRSIDGWEEDGLSVVAETFHRLCRKAHTLLKCCDFKVPEDREAEARFWEDEAPYTLLAALSEGKMERFDAVVVDEGQDFSASWWDVLEELLNDKSKGRMLVFYDPLQDIFGRGCRVPEYPLLKLTRNFRNTQKISDVVCRLGRVKMTPFDRCPEGEPPVSYPLESAERVKAHLANLLKRLVNGDRLLPDQIAILTPHTKKNSSLADLSEIGGFRLESNPMDRGGAVLHSTISAFKGLESDVVILLDIDTADPLCNRNLRYVAASRARHRLYVYANGDWIEG